MAGGGGDTGKSTQTTEVKLPAWVEQASQSNYGFAKDVANRPYEANPYGGAEGVAGWNDLQNLAYNSTGAAAQYQPYYGQAGNALTGLLGYNPNQIQAGRVNAGQLAGADLSPYLNPYTENVINRTTDTMERSGKLAQNQIRSDAAKGSSFGGSRQAIQQGVQQAETTRAIGDYAGKAREAAFTNAQAQATNDINRAFEGDKVNLANWTDVQKQNVANDLAAKGLQRQAANDLVAAATAGQDSAIKTLAQYMSFGSAEQAQRQKVIDATSGQWQQERDYPLEQLNILLSSLGMSPYGKTETTTKKSEQKSGMDAGGMLGGFMQMAPALMALASDESLKTDIQSMGKDEATGIPIYAYRYKGDPKRYPKVVGPMAQDVEKKFPKLVRVVGRKKAIDLTSLAA